MGPTKSISHFSNGANIGIGVSGIANKLVGLPILSQTSHCCA